MANYIDISSKLEASKPMIRLGPNDAYEINDDKNAVLKMQAALKNESDNEIEGMSMLFTSLLGEEAVKDIEAKYPGATTRLSQMRVVMIAITAALSGISFEEAEKRFRE